MQIKDILFIFVFLAFALNYIGTNSTILFVVSLLAILPLAAKMGEATEELAKIYGGHIGGLLNATFGNAAELIIALLAINKGLLDLVKASIAGSIIGNILFVLGLSLLLGGLKYKEQKFSKHLAGLNATMLLIAFMSIMIPSLFHLMPDQVRNPKDELGLSIIVSILLISLYLLSILFSLKTHSHLFTSHSHKSHEDEKPKWSRNKAILVLLISTVFLALISEIFVAQIETFAKSFNLTELFIGAVIVAIVGNAAEHISAVSFAMKNELDVAIGITVGSSLQIALFVAPVAVLAGIVMKQPMDLVFTPFEIIAVFASVLIVNEISSDESTNWFEGAQLVIMYLIIAVLFYFVK
ncbi:MAG: calcium/proton exchanger [Candidatus Micrarchaeota archaeon]